jgi:hypothetical protein
VGVKFALKKFKSNFKKYLEKETLMLPILYLVGVEWNQFRKILLKKFKKTLFSLRTRTFHEVNMFKKFKILLIGNNIFELNVVKNSLKNVFWIIELGEPAYILGIEIYRDRPKRLLCLSQSTYIDKMLKRFSMSDSKKKIYICHMIHIWVRLSA